MSRITGFPSTPERVAFFLCAMAVAARAVGGREPVAASIKPSPHAYGYLQFAAEKGGLPTTSDMQKHIVVHLAGVAAGEALDEQSVGSSAVFSSARQMASRLAQTEIVDNWEQCAQGTLEAGMKRARALVIEHRADIEALAAMLADKGELNEADLKGFLSKVNSDG